jgi:hypothetical protein
MVGRTRSLPLYLATQLLGWSKLLLRRSSVGACQIGYQERANPDRDQSAGNSESVHGNAESENSGINRQSAYGASTPTMPHQSMTLRLLRHSERNWYR